MSLAFISVESSVAAITALVVAVITLIGTWKNSRKINEVHVLVNQRMTDVLNRVTQLTNKMEEENIEIPPDPSDYHHK